VGLEFAAERRQKKKPTEQIPTPSESGFLPQAEPSEGTKELQQWFFRRRSAGCAAHLQQSKANYHPVFIPLHFPN
jgi:hypothetical protein